MSTTPKPSKDGTQEGQGAACRPISDVGYHLPPCAVLWGDPRHFAGIMAAYRRYCDGWGISLVATNGTESAMLLVNEIGPKMGRF